MPGTQRLLIPAACRRVCACAGRRAGRAHGCGRFCRGQPLSSLLPPGVSLQPQLASVTFATNNPTLSTVALEKPLCMFDSTAALYGTYEIYLYALVNSGEGHWRGLT